MVGLPLWSRLPIHLLRVQPPLKLTDGDARQGVQVHGPKQETFYQGSDILNELINVKCSSQMDRSYNLAETHDSISMTSLLREACVRKRHGFIGMSRSSLRMCLYETCWSRMGLGLGLAGWVLSQCVAAWMTTLRNTPSGTILTLI